MTNSLRSIFFSLHVAKDCFLGSALRVGFTTGTLVGTDMNQKTLSQASKGCQWQLQNFYTLEIKAN